MPRNRFRDSRNTTFSTARRVFRAVVATVVPEAGQLEEQGWRELEERAELSVRDRPSALRSQLRFFLRAIEWLPLLRYGRTFTALSAEQRTNLLHYLENHPLEVIRCGFWAVRTLAFLGYYTRRETLETLGYAADPRGWRARG